jgi:predicted chitinase
MEYQVILKNPFLKAEALLRLSGVGAGSFLGFGGSAMRSFAPMGFSAPFGGPLVAQAPGLPVQSYYQSTDYSLHFLSAKGGQGTDYYKIDNRTLVYNRFINWAYWEAPSLEVTAAQLKAICPPATTADISKHITHLNDAMKKYEINTRLRQVHFLCQLAHESGHFAKTLEGASGKAYEGRVKYLKNTQPGDGPRFKGRGLIQLTGRDAYTQYGSYIGRNLTDGENMKLVEQEPYASDCSGWFWSIYKKYAHLNAKADKDDFTAISIVVNGGLNGIAERKTFYQNAKRVFGL